MNVRIARVPARLTVAAAALAVLAATMPAAAMLPSGSRVGVTHPIARAHLTQSYAPVSAGLPASLVLAAHTWQLRLTALQDTVGYDHTALANDAVQVSYDRLQRAARLATTAQVRAEIVADQRQLNTCASKQFVLGPLGADTLSVTDNEQSATSTSDCGAIAEMLVGARAELVSMTSADGGIAQAEQILVAAIRHRDADDRALMRAQHTLESTLAAEPPQIVTALALIRSAEDSAGLAAFGQLMSTLRSTAHSLRPAAAAVTAIHYALAHLGDPYLWGGTGPTQFDCSGLVQSAYAVAHVHLPRTAAEQAIAGTPVPLSDLLPGDLIYWAYDPSDPTTIHHVAMYLGDGFMIQAPHTGDVVQISQLWPDGLYGATRPVPAVTGPVTAKHHIHHRPRPHPSTRPTPTAMPTSPSPAPSPSATSSPTPTGTPASPTATDTPSASPSASSAAATPSPS